MSWNLTDALDAIEITMEADTLGWIAVGWGEQLASHRFADMIVGWVVSGEPVVLLDSYSNSKVGLSCF